MHLTLVLRFGVRYIGVPLTVAVSSSNRRDQVFLVFFSYFSQRTTFLFWPCPTKLEAKGKMLNSIETAWISFVK